MARFYTYGGFFREGESGEGWISGRRWPRFPEYSFDDREDGVYVTGVGVEGNEYFLDSPVTEADMLADYSNVRDSDSCMTFLERWGFPMESPAGPHAMRLEYILATAGTIRLIRNLNHALSSPAKLKKYACLRPTQPFRTEGDALDGLSCPTMRKAFAAFSAKEGWELKTDKIQVEFHPETLDGWHGHWGTKAPDTATELRQIRHASIIFRKDWLFNRSSALQTAAQMFITQLMDDLMQDVRQGLVRVKNGDGTPGFKPVIRISEPWECIVYGLYRELAGGGSVRVCPACGKSFSAKRKDKISCGKAGCQKQVTEMNRLEARRK